MHISIEIIHVLCVLAFDQKNFLTEIALIRCDVNSSDFLLFVFGRETGAVLHQKLDQLYLLERACSKQSRSVACGGRQKGKK